MSQQYNLFLDDFRLAKDAFDLTKDIEYLQDWVVVENCNQFVDYITKTYDNQKTLPTVVSFDHDLCKEHYGYLSHPIPYESFAEKTGWHCAVWLKQFCVAHDIPCPRIKIHTQNTAGRENIEKVFKPSLF